MTTTLVRDSVVGDDWIQRTSQSIPLQRTVNQATGEPDGNFLTGPVRLAFCNLFELPKPKPGQTSDPKYGTSILFPPTVDLALLYEEYYRICGQVFPEYYDATTQQYHGLQSPFHDQAEKLRYGGFTPGCVSINTNSKFKPSITDSNLNPIVDTNRVYPGVWAICAINAYDYGKNPPQPKKGVAFGLQSVMIIGDDTKFGGGAPQAKDLFAGINVDAPIVRPDMAAQMGGQQPAQQPVGGIPGYSAPAGSPAPAAPAVPQQHFTPPGAASAPAASNPTAAPAPASAPAATTSPTDTDFLS